MHFDVSLYEQGLYLAAIANKLASLLFDSKSAGFADPCLDFRIRRALQGWAKSQSRSDYIHVPVSPLCCHSSLLAAVPLVCSSSYELLLFRASFLFAFEVHLE